VYNILIDLKSRLKLYLSRLRCNMCYAPYSSRCPIYLCESGSDSGQSKIKFIADSCPPETPLAFIGRFPIMRSAKPARYYLKSFEAVRVVVHPNKERCTRNVLSLEICCSKCNNVKELEIDLDDFLPKRYSNAIVNRSLGYPDEEDED